MTKHEFYFLSADRKTNIHAVEWQPEGVPKAVLQIAHGVTEHILCYEEMAEYFTKKGFVVVGNDHLGHGTSIAEGAKSMYLGQEGSWKWVVKDIDKCMKMTKERYPDIPYILLGLSLGSFAVRTHAILHPGKVDGIVLAGTGQSPAPALVLARFMANLEAKKAGEENSTPAIKKLTFEDYNKKFAPNRTDFDWLCASEKGLDGYLADPLRGDAMSCGLFREMLNGMIFTGNLKNQKQMDADVPVLLVSGEDDPVGDCGKGIERTKQSLQKAGVKDVTMKLYPGLRHDIFLEDEKKDIFEDIFKWAEKKCL